VTARLLRRQTQLGEGGKGSIGKWTFDMKAVVEIELIRLVIHNNDGKIAEAIESAGSRIERP